MSGERRVTADTLDAPLEKSLAPLAGPHAVVVTGGVVVTHGAEVHVSFPHCGGARGGVHAFHFLLRSFHWWLDGAAEGKRKTL